MAHLREGVWQQFDEWCLSVALPSLPAGLVTVAMIITVQADEGRAVTTLGHRLVVEEVMRGLRRARTKEAVITKRASNQCFGKMHGG